MRLSITYTTYSENEMGRPPLGVKRVQFMLPPKLIVRIRKIQKNVSDFIRKAIEEKLLRDEKKK